MLVAKEEKRGENKESKPRLSPYLDLNLGERGKVEIKKDAIGTEDLLVTNTIRTNPCERVLCLVLTIEL